MNLDNLYGLQLLNSQYTQRNDLSSANQNRGSDDLPFLIVIAGPTASGKSALAYELARAFESDIISADSRQIYRGLNIGTAKPPAHFLENVKHHFINIRNVDEVYSVGNFESEALVLLDSYFKSNKIMICAGGTGFYIRALLEGLDDIPPITPGISRKYQSIYDKSGITGLIDLIKRKDPDYYANADIQNPHRLIRALAVCESSGKAYSSFLTRKKKVRNFRSINVCLDVERSILYERINSRVDEMIEEGLMEEVIAHRDYRSCQALQTVGYKEIFDHLDGKTSMETTVQEIKKNTRRYAKRQLTWFRNQGQWQWCPPNVSAIKRMIDGYSEL
jgi:tRNA dimethylallyltransferase